MGRPAVHHLSGQVSAGGAAKCPRAVRPGVHAGFVDGYVLCTGQRTLAFGDRLREPR